MNNGISCIIASTSLSCTFQVFSKWSYLCHCHRYLSKVTSTYGYYFWLFFKWSCLCLCLFIVNFVKCLKVSRIALYLCSQKYLTKQVYLVNDKETHRAISGQPKHKWSSGEVILQFVSYYIRAYKSHHCISEFLQVRFYLCANDTEFQASSTY